MHSAVARHNADFVCVKYRHNGRSCTSVRKGIPARGASRAERLAQYDPSLLEHSSNTAATNTQLNQELADQKDAPTLSRSLLKNSKLGPGFPSGYQAGCTVAQASMAMPRTSAAFRRFGVVLLATNVPPGHWKHGQSCSRDVWDKFWSSTDIVKG